MAKIECIKSKWIRNVECFGNTNVFFTGLKISEGNKIRYYPQPVNVQLKGKSLIIRDNGREDVWDLSTSALTHQQIKALIANCSCCNDGSPLCQTFFVEEAQSEFAINVPTGSVLAANTLLVFINGQQKPSNSIEFGWSITGTAPNYTVTFNDDIVPFPGQPPHEVTICYGYNTSIPSEYVTQEELDASIAALPTLASGTYTPVASDLANLPSVTTLEEAQYMRVGNTVTVSGQITTPTESATNTQTSFEIDLPIASIFTDFGNLAGVIASVQLPATGTVVGHVSANTNNRATFIWISGAVPTGRLWKYTFTYRVI